MLYEEILYRVLQFSTAAGSVALLITCMRMHGVRWWLPAPIYALAFGLFVTFLVTFFMRTYTFEALVADVFLLAISSISTAVNRLLMPMTEPGRQTDTRRLLTVILPTIAILIGVWVFGVAYEGGTGYFKRMLGLMHQVIQTQQRQEVTLKELREGGVYRQAQIDLLKAENLQRNLDARKKAHQDSIMAGLILGNQADIKRELARVKAQQKAQADAERFKQIPPKKPWWKIGYIDADSLPDYISKRYEE